MVHNLFTTTNTSHAPCRHRTVFWVSVRGGVRDGGRTTHWNLFRERERPGVERVGVSLTHPPSTRNSRKVETKRKIYSWCTTLHSSWKVKETKGDFRTPWGREGTGVKGVGQVSVSVSGQRPSTPVIPTHDHGATTRAYSPAPRGS